MCDGCGDEIPCCTGVDEIPCCTRVDEIDLVGVPRGPMRQTSHEAFLNCIREARIRRKENRIRTFLMDQKNKMICAQYCSHLRELARIKRIRRRQYAERRDLYLAFLEEMGRKLKMVTPIKTPMNLLKPTIKYPFIPGKVGKIPSEVQTVTCNPVKFERASRQAKRFQGTEKQSARANSPIEIPLPPGPDLGCVPCQEYQNTGSNDRRRRSSKGVEGKASRPKIKTYLSGKRVNFNYNSELDANTKLDDTTPPKLPMKPTPITWRPRLKSGSAKKGPSRPRIRPKLFKSIKLPAIKDDGFLSTNQQKPHGPRVRVSRIKIDRITKKRKVRAPTGKGSQNDVHGLRWFGPDGTPQSGPKHKVSLTTQIASREICCKDENLSDPFLVQSPPPSKGKMPKLPFFNKDEKLKVPPSPSSKTPIKGLDDDCMPGPKPAKPRIAKPRIKPEVSSPCVTLFERTERLCEDFSCASLAKGQCIFSSCLSPRKCRKSPCTKLCSKALTCDADWCPKPLKKLSCKKIKIKKLSLPRLQWPSSKCIKPLGLKCSKSYCCRLTRRKCPKLKWPKCIKDSKCSKPCGSIKNLFRKPSCAPCGSIKNFFRKPSCRRLSCVLFPSPCTKRCCKDFKFSNLLNPKKCVKSECLKPIAIKCPPITRCKFAKKVCPKSKCGKLHWPKFMKESKCRGFICPPACVKIPKCPKCRWPSSSCLRGSPCSRCALKTNLCTSECSSKFRSSCCRPCPQPASAECEPTHQEELPGSGLKPAAPCSTPQQMAVRIKPLQVSEEKTEKCHDSCKKFRITSTVILYLPKNLKVKDVKTEVTAEPSKQGRRKRRDKSSKTEMSLPQKENLLKEKSSAESSPKGQTVQFVPGPSRPCKCKGSKGAIPSESSAASAFCDCPCKTDSKTSRLAGGTCCDPFYTSIHEILEKIRKRTETRAKTVHDIFGPKSENSNLRSRAAGGLPYMYYQKEFRFLLKCLLVLERSSDMAEVILSRVSKEGRYDKIVRDHIGHQFGLMVQQHILQRADLLLQLLGDRNILEITDEEFMKNLKLFILAVTEFDSKKPPKKSNLIKEDGEAVKRILLLLGDIFKRNLDKTCGYLRNSDIPNQPSDGADLGRHIISLDSWIYKAISGDKKQRFMSTDIGYLSEHLITAVINEFSAAYIQDKRYFSAF